MENIYMRKANLDDCIKLSELKKQVWSTTYNDIYPEKKLREFDIEKNSEKFKNIINNPDINLFALCCDNNIIGYMSCGSLYKPFKDYKQEIGLLYILQEYKGLGLGKQLFLKAFDIIKNKGYKEFIISCNKYNFNAQKFYKKMGGEEIHTDEDNEDKSMPQIVFLYKIK